ANGALVFTGLSAGEWTVTAYDQRRIFRPLKVSLTKDQTVTLTEATDGATLTVVSTTENMPGTQWILVSGNHAAPPLDADETRNARDMQFHALQPGAWTLFAFRRGGSGVEVSRHPVTITDAPAQTLRVTPGPWTPWTPPAR
ncbi:MAG: hypothetical protein JNG84_00755, partial [Archangium sp.]|nr:hypothetical protein [Archangium sp.]